MTVAILVASVLALTVSLLVAVVAMVVVTIATARVVRWGSVRLASRLVDGREADEREHARFVNLVEGLCTTAGVQRPRLRVVDTPGLNLCSFGIDERDAVVVATSGLLSSLTRVELEGVLAHELAHLKDGEMCVATLSILFVAPLILSAETGSRAGDVDRSAGRRGPGVSRSRSSMLAPLARWLCSRYLPPERETAADLEAVRTTRYPPALASALKKISADSSVPGQGRLTAHLWTADPSSAEQVRSLAGGRGGFTIRPPMAERIALLEEL